MRTNQRKEDGVTLMALRTVTRTKQTFVGQQMDVIPIIQQNSTNIRGRLPRETLHMRRGTASGEAAVTNKLVSEGHIRPLGC